MITLFFFFFSDFFIHFKWYKQTSIAIKLTQNKLLIHISKATIICLAGIYFNQGIAKPISACFYLFSASVYFE